MMLRAPRRTTLIVALYPALLGLASPAVSQAPQPAPHPLHARDTLHLAALQAAAVRRDPRGRQLELLATQSSLRLRNLEAERLPTVGANALAQYQSDVATVPLQLPGVRVPRPPKDNADASLAIRQRLYDPSVAPRRELERAQLAESQARVRTSLFNLRQSVNEAYFSALLLQSQRAEVESGIADVEAQLELAQDRVRLGSALPSEAATLEAELLRRRQTIAELTSNRDAALVILGDLTGIAVSPSDTLVPPDLARAVAQSRGSVGDLRVRPEYEQFARSRDALGRQEATVAAKDRPRISAFGRAGYGRPGLNPLSSEFDTYWVAGIQVEWSPWNWGTTDRDRETLAVQQQIVATEEAAFAETIRRGVVRDLAAIDRLEKTLAADDEIIALRERVLRETRLRFSEGVVTSAEFVDRETDVLTARLQRATHRVELDQARARFLTFVGIEVR